MVEDTDKLKLSKMLNYDRPESPLVFRIAWYVVASRPGVLLKDYSEAESKIFKAKALFQVDLDGIQTNLRLWVEEAQRSLEYTAWGENESVLNQYLDELIAKTKVTLSKYNSLSDDEKQRVKLILIAKGCWDKAVFAILNKAPAGEVYFHVAHGREMIIKAKKDDELNPLALTTSGWLSKIESYPRDEPLPAAVATELAKKTVEWKKETHILLYQYL